MKAISSLVVVLCVAGIAMAQEAVQLGQTQPVDLKVTDINWHPNGKGIIYTRELETGIGLGTYVNGKFAGKVVLELGKTDTFSTYWFHTQAAALVI
ncbi:MAG TPA: hypothetical protein VK171_06575, partial [Fimbriimonas sp.]|nr:hypothetical protein [Fimbriimonas sp.]